MKKKYNFNKIINKILILIFSLTLFTYSFQTTNYLEALGGHENAGGRVILVTECTCDPDLRAFRSIGRNGGDYVDSSLSSTHYERGRVNTSTTWHISKTTFERNCKIATPNGCINNPLIPSGRLLLFGGTNK